MSITQTKNYAPVAERYLEAGSFTKAIYDREGQEGLQRYLNGRHIYSIAATTALWSSIQPDQFRRVFNPGALGHHALIRLPGRRIVQLAREEEPWESHLDIMTQLELRSATGRQIEGMWQTHKELIVKYRAWGSPSTYPAGHMFYCPFLNDCFHYADAVLTQNGQEKTNLSRVRASKHPYTSGLNKPMQPLPSKL